MPNSSMRADPPSQPRPFSSSTKDPHTPGSDGFKDQVDPAVWKRRYLALKETVNISSKRKSENTTSISRLGRGIRKVIFICGDIRDLVSESDKYCAYMDDSDDMDLNKRFEGLNEDEVAKMKRNWERSHTAVRELNRLIPNFQKTIDQAPFDELHKYYADLQRGANSARSYDLNQIRKCIAQWLNASEHPDVLLNPNCRMNRGIEHDVTGRLLCPAEFDWDNLDTRAKLRVAGVEKFDWLSSYHSTCFYEKFKADVEHPENGFLKSILLVQVYKAIFISPSSAKDGLEEKDDDENIPPAKALRMSTGRKPVRRNSVASKVYLNERVTPRSIAYAAVQLHFNLQTASSWSQIYGGFDYQGLYNFVVDVFEDTPGPVEKQRATDLLKWWSSWHRDRKIFPNAALHRRGNTSASRKAFKEQRAAREREEGV